jgi:ribonuclease P/MRP protein subunit RPP1
MTTVAGTPRLADIRPNYDIIALRPVDEKTLSQAAFLTDADIISLDLTRRYLFPFKQKTLMLAVEKGVKIELCYSPGLVGDEHVRRLMIQNASALIKATRGRGIIISSEAAGALGCRAPHDLVNLATVWGLKQDRAVEAVAEQCRMAVAASQLRKRSFRGAIDVVYGGEKPPPKHIDEKSSKQKKRRGTNNAGPEEQQTPQESGSKKIKLQTTEMSTSSNPSGSK